MEHHRVSVQNLGGLTVLGESNVPVELSDLWKEKTAVLVFVRHFG